MSHLGSDVAVTICCPHMLNYSPVGQDEAVVSDLAFSKVHLANENNRSEIELISRSDSRFKKDVFKLKKCLSI